MGLSISAFIVKAKSVYPVTFGIALGTFFLNIVSAVSDKPENLKYLFVAIFYEMSRDRAEIT